MSETDRAKDGQVGCYDLYLYCSQYNPAHPYNEFPHQFIGYDRSDTRRQARNAGWTLHRDGSATCPICNPNHQILRLLNPETDKIAYIQMNGDKIEVSRAHGNVVAVCNSWRTARRWAKRKGFTRLLSNKEMLDIAKR